MRATLRVSSISPGVEVHDPCEHFPVGDSRLVAALAVPVVPEGAADWCESRRGDIRRRGP
jgi:hypothetical protein